MRFKTDVSWGLKKKREASVAAARKREKSVHGGAQKRGAACLKHWLKDKG